jgi:amino-acid N-acetyltransferase
MEIEYTSAKDNDLDSLTGLLNDGRGDSTALELDRFIIARDNENIIGCVRTKDLADDCIELASLIVLPAYRGKGIGTKLVNEVIKKDIRRPIYLLCMKDKENFYKKAGFMLIEKTYLPVLLQNEYNRVAQKLPEAKENIITMMLN